jgi:hypothetical protein
MIEANEWTAPELKEDLLELLNIENPNENESKELRINIENLGEADVFLQEIQKKIENLRKLKSN